jgi:SpoIID/LytB domain protein
LLVTPTVDLSPVSAPVHPKVTKLSIPSVAQTAGAPKASVKRVDTPFDIAGVTFAGPAPKSMVIEARTRTDGAWSDWSTLALMDAAPDPKSPEAARARTGTEPITAPDADGIDIRITAPGGHLPSGLTASLIDAGTAPADHALGAGPPGSALASVAKPAVITRAAWGADESLRTCDPTVVDRFDAAVVHHTVDANDYTADQAAGLVRGIYAYHTTTLGWCDIGYQFLVDRFGRIYEGRVGNLTGNTQGAQAQGFNAQSFGVSTLGDFQAVAPSSAAVGAVVSVIAWKADENGFDPGATVTLTSAGNSKYPAGTVVTVPRTVGHRDFNDTACPGDAMYAGVPSIRARASDEYAAARASWTQLHPKTVEETFVRPNGTTIALSGHGSGPGIGLSQWGAFGAANKGLTWRQIASFYYAGTAVSSQGNPTLRVRLDYVGTGGTYVPSQPGLYVSDGSRSAYLTTSYPWRIIRDGGGLTLQYRMSGGWVRSTAWTAKTTPLTLYRPSYGSVQVTLPNGARRAYAGSIRTLVSGTATATVNVTTTEDYVRAVTPLAMNAGWPAAALQTQSVAMRTHATYNRRANGGAIADTCDTSACLVYRGLADYTATGSLARTWTDSRTTAAASATAGLALTYGGVPARTPFTGANGGRTVYGGAAYLPAKVDPYDAAIVSSNNPTKWSMSVATSSIEAAYPSIGTLQSIAITGRSGGGDWSGRTTGVRLNGAAGTVALSAEAFRSKLGLRSTWWTVTSTSRSSPLMPRDLTADGLPDALVPAGSNLWVLKYTGSMSFDSTTISSSWSGLRLTAGVGPWDRDNLGDVVAATSDGGLWLYPGNATSTLDRGRLRIGNGWGIVDTIIPTGDMSGDGYADFLARWTDGTLHIYRGNGTGAVASSATIGSGWQTLSQLAPGDFDGDGRTDLMGVRKSDGRLVLYRGTGVGTVQPGVLAGSSTDFRFAAEVKGVGDLDGDGRDDLLIRRAVDGALRAYPVTGTGTVGVPIAAGSWSGTTPWGQ